MGLQHQEKRLLNYSYDTRLKFRHLGFIWYILPGLMMVLSLLTLWRINRHAVSSSLQSARYFALRTAFNGLFFCEGMTV